MDDWNNRIIEEFRSNGGKVGGPFTGAPLLLLTTRGAKSGKEHVTPVMYLADGDRVVIFASMGGAPRSPAWYHNLVANPRVRVEAGADTFDAAATVAHGSERDDLYARQSQAYPQFADVSKRLPGRFQS